MYGQYLLIIKQRRANRKKVLSRKQEFNLDMPSFEVPVSIAITPEADTVYNPTNQTELEFKWEKSKSAFFTQSSYSN